MSTLRIDLEEINAARARIVGHVRRTPLLPVTALREPPAWNGALYLKLECMQVTGSFKARGAMNKLLTLPAGAAENGLVTASGGNHGLAVAHAGRVSDSPATIYVPVVTPEAKIRRLEQSGARVIIEGAVFDEASKAAQRAAERLGLTNVHSFADPAVIAGQGTITLEILEDLPQMDTLLVAVGGGGLISGVSTAAKALKPSIRVIGVEPVGAAAMSESIKAGRLVELPELKTAATSLAAKSCSTITLDIVRRNVDELVLVSDEEMRQAVQWLWSELGVAAELSAGATVAALLSGRIQTQPDERVCAIICGAGSDGIL